MVTLSAQYFDLAGMYWDPMQPVLLPGYNSTVVNIGTTITIHFASTFFLVILNPGQRDSPSTQFASTFVLLFETLREGVHQVLVCGIMFDILGPVQRRCLDGCLSKKKKTGFSLTLICTGA